MAMRPNDLAGAIRVKEKSISKKRLQLRFESTIGEKTIFEKKSSERKRINFFNSARDNRTVSTCNLPNIFGCCSPNRMDPTLSYALPISAS